MTPRRRAALIGGLAFAAAPSGARRLALRRGGDAIGATTRAPRLAPPRLGA